MRRLLALALVGPALVGLRVAAADYAQVGTLQNTSSGGQSEVDVVFDPSVSELSARSLENYTFSDPNIQLQNLRFVPLNHGVILTVSGLLTNTPYSLTLSNLQNEAGTALPAASFNFRSVGRSWAAIGGQELGFTPEALAVGTNGFDLISGGAQMRDIYDESTFVYEALEGDFDKSIRVEFQEPSSESARAGLMAREFLNAGQSRPADPFDPAQAFSRYIQVDVNPATTAYEGDDGETAPGQNRYEVNVRFFAGGIGSPNFDATETFTNATSVPNYPNAWVRLKRTGQTFHAFRSENGTNWVLLGSYTFPSVDVDGNPVDPFGSTALVGPNYSPEVANIPLSSDARRAFLAQFRDYGDATGNTPIEPTESKLSIARVGDQVEISWTGVGALQTSTTLETGSWTPVAGSSPVRLAPDKEAQFFRVKVQ